MSCAGDWAVQESRWLMRGTRWPCRYSVKNRGAVISQAQLSFSVQKQLGYGDKVVVVGGPKPLGKWKLDRAAELKWNENDVWTGTVEVSDNSDLEFKVVTVNGYGEAQWEHGDNRKIHVDSKDVTVRMEYDNTSANEQSLTDANEQNGTSHSSSVDAGDEADKGSSSSSDGNFSSDERLPHTQWQGKSIDFMRENKHTKERSGVWNKDGLAGAMLELVAGDEKAGSWLQKLEVAKTLVVDKSPDMRPQLDALAPLYIYLHWISTGTIQCVEGGGHFRPNRHAELSKIMFRSMEWVGGDQNKTPLERLIARKVVSKLPSFSEAFTASVPLTRIRDIAHRNDIPHDLKREIKHTLQNKLHRNAGPEDLVATELMLERITKTPGEYNDAFVNEFKIFTDELRDFFSAGSLTSMLDAVRPVLEDNDAVALDRFFEAKRKVDGAGMAADLNLIMDLMHKLTTVRAILMNKLSAGLRNDAPDSAMAMRQRVRLGEIRCEEYSYVMLSRLINFLEEQGGSDYLAGAKEEAWAQPIGAMVLAVRHCGLSGWRAGECFAIEQELEAWQRLGVAGDKDQVARLKASLERAQRLTDEYAEVMLETFADSALAMGKALGVSTEVQQIFTEAEIRANVAFQLSKLTTMLLKGARTVLGCGDFDPLVTGTAIGELVQVPEIKAGQEHAGGRPCVLLVGQADGDEEVTSAGRNIRGVILCQDLPHLSHLGVRARQEGVTFVTCTTTDVIDSTVKPLIGKQIELSTDGIQVTIKESSGAEHTSTDSASNGSSAVPVSQPIEVEKVDKAKVVPLSAAQSKSCGAKAAACARLAEAASGAANGASFSTVAGAVLPFGCMEAAIRGAGKQSAFDDLLQKVETCPADELQGHCDAMQDIIKQSPPDDTILNSLQEQIPGASIVIARSSANVEDLAGMSGAGLYESIPNVDLSSPDSVRSGITGVWASLFAKRAVLSRRTAGVKQSDACMAVLVQEMLTPSMSFVLHTRNIMGNAQPDRGASALYAEVAPGLGEILASGTSGSAWRMVIDKASEKVSTLAFANFSQAYLPGRGKRTQEPGASIYWSSQDSVAEDTSKSGKVDMATVDYSKQDLSMNDDKRTALAQRLCRIGVLLEKQFEGAQDIEGALVDDAVYVVQTRPQP